MDPFVHLHVHTEYSLLDGACRIGRLISRAEELGQTAIAITDHGAMYGAVQFYREATKRGIRPILGCEVYVTEGSRSARDHNAYIGHLLLLAETNEGYRNLMKIVSEAHLNGFYYKPRVDLALLEECREGLIACSACMAGEIPHALMQGNREKAKQILERYTAIFDRRHFYIELQNQGIAEQAALNAQLSELAREAGLRTVATNDVHYCTKEDAETQDLLLCIQTGKTLQDPDRLKFPTAEFYLKSGEEMREALGAYPSALEATAEIAERCRVMLDFETRHLPQYPMEGDRFGYLKELCEEGLARKYDPLTPEITERLEYELSTIRSMGFTDYFLIVWDYVKYAKDHNIAVGPGRGSAAGSIVSYALDISTVDPIRYDLLFERFLNPERVSMPDIDIDFCDERRDEVIDYVVRKYGEDRVARIVTFGTFAARAAVRDVARAMDLPYAMADKAAKLVGNELHITLDEAMNKPALRQACREDPYMAKLMENAKKLEGMVRHTSTHAAGVLISAEETVHFVPLIRQQDAVTTQFPMDDIGSLGLLKMDFLGLKNLTFIEKSVELIAQLRGEQIRPDEIPEDDKATYRLISQGRTDGVFQLESAGMKQFMRELKPDGIEDLIAGISLFRPGPAKSIPNYVEGKRHPETITYPHPMLEEILRPTYGCIVYQEQVMQIVRKMGGYSLGRADLLRRAMSKKKKEVMEQERAAFLEGAVSRGVSRDAAERIYNDIADFAEYAFNKSHAAAYAVLAYRTAWLKAHYPEELMASVLTGHLQNPAKLAAYRAECEEMGIRVLPPDINESLAEFAPNNGAIRFGLAAVKHVGKTAVEVILQRRRQGVFTSFYGFLERTASPEINKRTVESLIRCGAFDRLDGNRAQYLSVYEEWMDGIAGQRRNNLEGQFSLFEGTAQATPRLPEILEFDRQTLLSMEQEMIGMYLSGNPLEELSGVLKGAAKHTTAQVTEQLHDKTVMLAGMVLEPERKKTKSGEQMAVFRLMDLNGTREVLVFPKLYRKAAELIEAQKLICLEGRVSAEENGSVRILAQKIDPLSPGEAKRTEHLAIRLHSGQRQAVCALLDRFAGGSTQVYLYIEETRQWQKASREKCVYCSDLLLQELRRILGDDKVELK